MGSPSLAPQQLKGAHLFLLCEAAFAMHWDRFLGTTFDPWSLEQIAAAVALALGLPAGLVFRVALHACLVMCSSHCT